MTQQVVFIRNEDPEYAEKMEKTRKEVYKQLGRQDLIDKMDESYIPDYENKGYKEAEKLISSLRSKVYKKLSDSELDEFTRAMADHMGL